MDAAELKRRVARNAERALAHLVARMQEKASTPDSTGALADSIKYEFDENSLAGRIVVESDHAAAVEFGTSKMAPHSFVRRTLDEEAPNVKKILGAE